MLFSSLDAMLMLIKKTSQQKLLPSDIITLYLKMYMKKNVANAYIKYQKVNINFKIINSWMKKKH